LFNDWGIVACLLKGRQVFLSPSYTEPTKPINMNITKEQKEILFKYGFNEGNRFGLEGFEMITDIEFYHEAFDGDYPITIRVIEDEDKKGKLVVNFHHAEDYHYRYTFNSELSLLRAANKFAKEYGIDSKEIMITQIEKDNIKAAKEEYVNLIRFEMLVELLEMDDVKKETILPIAYDLFKSLDIWNAPSDAFSKYRKILGDDVYYGHFNKKSNYLLERAYNETLAEEQ
jgi:hypothetical protein